MIRNLKQNYIVMAVLVIAAMSLYILVVFVGQIPAGDEMVFIRITDNLPDYSSKMSWWTLGGVLDPNKDGIICPFTGRDDNPFYEAAYETPIWHHPPFANYLAYPFVKLLYSEGTDAEIIQGNKNLRVVAWAMLSFCIVSSAFLVRRMTKSDGILLLSMLPLAACYVLFTHWGHNWFYHDIFMLTSLVVALLMRHTKYEKFIYIPLFIMVGCKGLGFVFLLPFALENKKVLWCLSAWIPFIIMCYFATGDPFYRITHWLGVRQLTWQIINDTDSVHYGRIVLFHILTVLNNAGKIWLFLGVTFIPFGMSLNYAWRKRANWFYPSLFIASLVAAFVGGGYYYQQTPMMIAGILLVGSALALREKGKINSARVEAHA